MESKGKKKSAGSSSMLAPGFRFHPTDEELVQYYLKRKICGKAFRFDTISDIDIYKSEPWDLPSMSELNTRDLEWYFFSVLDKKYGNRARTNRATEKGYWKTTGKDRAVYHRTQIVGMKKTLVYHSGRAPKGQRTNWVMHEYRITDMELERAGIVQDAFVLCRVFQKSGSGPKYGAPFVEEEWEDDELELVPKGETFEEPDFGDDVYLNGLDLDQILQSDVPLDTVPLPLNFCPANGNFVEETTGPENNTHNNLLVCTGKQYPEPEQHDNFYNLPASFEPNVQPVQNKYIGESSKTRNSEGLDFLLDELFGDTFDTLQYGEEGFIEANDFLNPVGDQDSCFDRLDYYRTCMDANYDESLNFMNDPAGIQGNKDLVFDQFLLPPKEMNKGTEKAPLPSEQFIENNNKDATLPSDFQDFTKFQSDYHYPFIKRASQMLGNFPAPPAFASEFPSKDAILRLNSVTQIQNSNVRSSNKYEYFNLILSFGFARGDDGSSSLESSISAISKGWFPVMFMWVLFLFMSFKIGTYICVN